MLSNKVKSIFIFFGGCFLGFTPLRIQAQSSCDRNLDEVNYLYEIGRFQQAIDAVNSCLESSGYSRPSKIEAYAMLSKSLLAIDSSEKAKWYLRELLTIKDDYEPKIDDPLRFKKALDDVRASMKTNTITSVSKKAEKQELAPATIVVLTSKDIAERGYLTVEEMLDDLPGMDVSRTNGLVNKSVFVRGYRSANMSDRLLVVINGVEANEMWTQFAYLGKQLPVESIERVEMIYGPASSLYGANAFSGVLNIVTKGGSTLFKSNKTSFESEPKTEFMMSGRINTGAFNTQALEGTTAVKLKNGVVIQMNGKIYQSDENNLSKYPNWDGQWTEADFGPNHYRKTLTLVTTKDSIKNIYTTKDPTGTYHQIKGDSILPTQFAIDEAKRLDQLKYNEIPNIQGFYNKGSDPKIFSDKTFGTYANMRVTLGDLILDLHIEDRDEGATPDYVDRFFSVNSLFTNWQARQQFISSRYSKKLGDKWFFYNTAYYRISDFGVKSRLTTFNGYAQDRRELIDFFDPRRINPEWTRVSYFQQCKQFRDEFRAQYTINDHFDLLVGLEIRNGIFQSNYLTSAISDNAMLNGTVPSNPGGNNPAMFEGGGFGSFTYSNTAKKININVGGRYDYTWVNEDSKVSYGKFNPRLSAVFYPGNWVFKLIYSEAMFAFPSFVRFSSSVSRIPPDNLAPETVKNIEFNVTHVLKGGKFTTEWVGYKSTYADMLITNKVKGLDQYGNWPNTTNEVMGAQMNTQWKVNRFIDFNTNATVNHSVFLTPSSTNPDEITTLKTAQISDFTFYAGIGTKFLKDKIYFYISSNVVGNKYTGKGTSLANSTQLITIPGYQLINAAVKVDLFQNITFQVIGRNLLNHYYAAPGIRSASGSQSPLVPQPGRNIHLALNFRF